jgi:hypothetical protein
MVGERTSENGPITLYNLRRREEKLMKQNEQSSNKMETPFSISTCI